MIYICGKFELPNYKSKVKKGQIAFTENYCSSFSAVLGSSKSRKTTFSNFNEDSLTHFRALQLLNGLADFSDTRIVLKHFESSFI